MAPVLVNFTLPATLLVSVVITGPPDFNNTTYNLSGISLSNLFENRDVPIKASAEDVEVINSTLAPALASRTLSEGYVRFPDLHSAYKLYTTFVDWETARDKCIEEGAHLAIADTHEKVKRIRAIRDGDWISVGIQKSDTTDDWVRVDNGLPLASIPWGSEYEGEDILSDFSCSGITPVGLLRGFPCTGWTNWYACEIPI